MSLEMKESSSVKMFGPPTLEACAMASIHFNNIGTGDFLNPILQKEVDAFRMLVGEFKVISIKVEVRRADGKEVSRQNLTKHQGGGGRLRISKKLYVHQCMQ